MENNFAGLKDKMTEVIDNDAFSQYLKLEIVEFEDKFIRARIPFEGDVINNYGSTHGGVLYSIADIMGGVVACMTGNFCTTVEGHMNYLEPARSDKYIYVEAKRVRNGQHLVVVKCKIKNDAGKLLDDASFTYFKSNKPVIEDE